MIRAWRGCCELGGAHDNTTHSIHLEHLTIDVGNNNPGAIGVDFIAHNGGGIEDVEIKSGANSGYKGISLDREANGNCLFNKIVIAGFDIGISLNWGVYGSFFEDITFTNQRAVVIQNKMHPMAMRKVKSTNSVPFYKGTTTDYGQLILLDAQLTGGGFANWAIENTGSMYLRNISQNGYRGIAKDGTKEIGGTSLAEYSSDKIRQTLSSPDRMLNLPVKNMHVPVYEDTSKWVSVDKYENLASGGSWGRAIQSAIDDGASTIYFPSITHGAYHSAGATIYVRKNVRTIIGNFADLGGGKLVFDIDDSAAVVYVEHMRGASYEQKGKATVVLRRCMNGPINTKPGAGDLFVEDFCCGNIVVDGSNVWARDYNEETNGVKLEVKNGGRLWVLGLKTENCGQVGKVSSGGALEVLGGLIYCVQAQPSVPMYSVEDGALSIIHRELGNSYPIFVREIANGQPENVNPDFPHGACYVSNVKGIGGQAMRADLPRAGADRTRLRLFTAPDGSIRVERAGTAHGALALTVYELDGTRTLSRSMINGSGGVVNAMDLGARRLVTVVADEGNDRRTARLLAGYRR